MNTNRETRMEALGAMRALSEVPSNSAVDRDIKQIIIPSFIRIIEDCNELETKFGDLLATLRVIANGGTYAGNKNHELAEIAQSAIAKVGVKQ